MKTTLADIADKAGVSKMTVSRVLSGKGPVAQETREKILTLVQEMAYQPNLLARSLASNRTMILGVILPKIEHLFLDNYIAQVLSGITDIALKNNYRIMLCPFESYSPGNQDYLNLARTKLLDGLILLKTRANDPHLEPLADSGFPFVLVNFKAYDSKYNFVDSQNIQGAKLAVKYLYDKGHRKIAFVSGSIEETNGRDRLTGYREAMAELGLPYSDNCIVYGDFNQEKAALAAEPLIHGPERPTAIFCADDYMAIGVMGRIKAAGLRVPEDIALVGFDDIELSAHIQPSLTTVRQPMSALGEASAQILMDLIDGEQQAPVHRLLDVTLIPRQSA